MTLSVLEGHSPFACLFRCNISYLWRVMLSGCFLYTFGVAFHIAIIAENMNFICGTEVVHNNSFCMDDKSPQRGVVGLVPNFAYATLDLEKIFRGRFSINKCDKQLSVVVCC